MNQDNSIGRTAVDNVANHFFARSRTTIAVAGRIESGKEREKKCLLRNGTIPTSLTHTVDDRPIYD